MINKRTVVLVGICLAVHKIVAVSIESAQLNGPCKTPNGEAATCLSLLSCPLIQNAVKTRNASAIEFARASQCGRDGRIPLVCCGTVAYFDSNLEDIFDIFDSGANGLKPSVPNENELGILKDLDSKDLPDRSVCGFHASDDRIFGGERTGVDEFPWMVALEYKDAGVRCGGSLINKRFILTAAHCVNSNEFELMHVRLGDWNLTSNPDCSDCQPVQIVKIAEKIPHPYYSVFSKNNDIALLRLEKDIEYNDFIRPICLPPVNFPAPEEGTKLTVSGWGATEEGKPASEIKLKVRVPTISNDKCKKVLNEAKIQANQVCAGGDAGKDACQGDSGGPLTRSFLDKARNRVQWYQEGIVSRGVKCGQKGYPAIYTRITRYITWILHKIESE